MAIKKIKISELPLVQSVVGLYTIGVDALNRSVKVGLEFIKTATDNADAAANNANTAAGNANTAATAANTAASNANEATVAANEAADDANSAAKSAISAAESANTAAASANSAATAANNAADRVDAAIETANEATENANAATTAANNAATAATNAASAANTAASNADTATDAANTAAESANNAASNASTAAGNANSAATAANNAASAANNAASNANEAADNANAAAEEARDPIEFTEAADLVNIASGDTTATIFGKLKKWFSSFGTLAWKSTVNYETEVTDKPSFKTVFSEAITGSGNINPKLIDDIEYDGATGDITISFSDGSSDKVINIPVDNFLATAEYDADTRILTLTMQNGEEIEIDLGELIHEYEAAENGGLEIVNGNQFKIKDDIMSDIAKIPVQKEIKLNVADWIKDDTYTGDGDLWAYVVEDSAVVEGCLFEAWPADRASKQVALQAEFDENIIVENNKFTITGARAPSGNINIIYTMML
jgi:chemotaxis protein histidine kinase CheA